jgi:hypothetical protein
VEGVVGTLNVGALDGGGPAGAGGAHPLPHEETLPAEAARRRRQRLRSSADTRPILVITRAALPDLSDAASGPEVVVSGRNSTHRIAPLVPESVPSVERALGGDPPVIADGHHRYSVAVEHLVLGTGAEPGPWDCIMAMIVGDSGAGLTVDAFHRRFASAMPLPEQTGNVFLIRRGPNRPQRPTDGEMLWWPGRGVPARLRPLPEALAAVPAGVSESAAAVARRFLYPMVGVIESEAEYGIRVRDAVQDLPPQGAALLLGSMPASAVITAARAGHRFPPKATRFHPKPLRGVLIRPLWEA